MSLFSIFPYNCVIFKSTVARVEWAIFKHRTVLRVGNWAYKQNAQKTIRNLLRSTPQILSWNAFVPEMLDTLKHLKRALPKAVYVLDILLLDQHRKYCFNQLQLFLSLPLPFLLQRHTEITLVRRISLLGRFIVPTLMIISQKTAELYWAKRIVFLKWH